MKSKYFNIGIVHYAIFFILIMYFNLIFLNLVHNIFSYVFVQNGFLKKLLHLGLWSMWSLFLCAPRYKSQGLCEINEPCCCSSVILLYMAELNHSTIDKLVIFLYIYGALFFFFLWHSYLFLLFFGGGVALSLFYLKELFIIL